jgi:hypothetical protein
MKADEPETNTIDNEQEQQVEQQLQQQQPIVQNVQQNVDLPTAPATKFLHILIPTVSRDSLPPDVDYLTPTVDQLLSQLNGNAGDPLAAPYNVEISLMNHNLQSIPHRRFIDLQQKYSSIINFISSNPTEKHTAKQFRVYQQTLDFLWSIKYLREHNNARYILFMEDDFLICDHAVMAMQYLIAKANDYYPEWVSLRVSYGLNGVIVKAQDLPLIINYYEGMVGKHGKTLPTPPDHLIYYFAEEQRKNNPARILVAFRYNLFSHIGDVSSFTGRAKRYNPNCYQVLYDWLQEGERFHNDWCKTNDVSPCSPDPSVQSKWSKLIDWDTNADHMLITHPEHFPLCGSNVHTEEDAKRLKCRMRRQPPPH